MNIAIFCNLDLESNIALNIIASHLTDHRLRFYVSKQVGAPASDVRPLQQLAYLEKEFILDKLFPHLESNDSGGYLSFDQLSKKYNAPLQALTSVTDEEIISDISSHQPDLFLSIRFGKIFKGKILSVPRLGIINLHSAILPNYKGVLGTFRAFQNKDEEIGTTIHFIDDNTIDTGKVININRMPITSGRSILWHIINLYLPGCEALIGVVNKLNSGTRVSSLNQKQGGVYYSFPSQSDFDEIETRGIRLFDVGEYATILNQFYKIDSAWVVKNLDHRRISSL
ncbi:MAG: formyltransferase family protein [Cyclobacteriaceae bacterium]